MKPLVTRWLFVSGRCSGCNDFPCRCPGPVTVECVCGGMLTAANTLEDKRQAHVDHVPTAVHQAYRDPRRHTAGSSLVTCPGTPGASAVEGTW